MERKNIYTYWFRWGIRYVLGPVLFLFLFYIMYRQVISQPHLYESWQQIKESFAGRRILYLLGAILLMLVNWGLEAYKWQLAMRKLGSFSFANAFKAILTGVSISIATPMRLGDYAGRVMHIEKGKRLQSMPVTFACNMAQLWVTLVIGTVCAWILKPVYDGNKVPILWWNLFIGLGIAGIAILSVLFLRTQWFVTRLQQVGAFKRFNWILKGLEGFKATLWVQILSLSFLRYVIFIAQYVCLFWFVNEPLQIHIIVLVVSVSLFVLSIIPGIALFTDLGLRGSLNMMLLGKFTTNSVGVGVISFLIWFINLILPAIIGAISIFKAKIFLNGYDKVSK